MRRVILAGHEGLLGTAIHRGFLAAGWVVHGFELGEPYPAGKCAAAFVDAARRGANESYTDARQYVTDNPKGSVVLISSIYGSRAPMAWNIRSPISYAMHKGALEQVVRCGAVHWRPARVNAVALGGVADGDEDWFAQEYAKRAPPLTPEDVVGPVLFLADETQSRAVTGAVLPVDGGWLAQ